MNTNIAVSGTTRLISTRDLIRQLINLLLQERTIDRDAVAEAIYLKWRTMRTPLGPWEYLPDHKREYFYNLADAAIAVMRDGGRS